MKYIETNGIYNIFESPRGYFIVKHPIPELMEDAAFNTLEDARLHCKLIQRSKWIP